ncbi:MAG TPA: glucoamylase family protein [Candidatus Nitrosocosmicus sp.]|nr:glucoamylase family protein [Candidatus Nitrosocosmicus sp.]
MMPFATGPIRAELLSIERLELKAEAIARDRVVSGQVADPALLGRVRDNGRVLLRCYRALAAVIQEERATTPAAEWLVDNFHIVEDVLNEIRTDLPPGFYRQLPRLGEGPFNGSPRVVGLASTLVAHTDSRFDPLSLQRFVLAFQRVQPLLMSELWAVPIALRLTLVENLRRLAEEIVEGREERLAADRLANTLLGQGDGPANPHAFRGLGDEVLTTPFAVQLAQRLRDQDPDATPAARWLEERLATIGMSSQDLVRAEHQRQGAANVTVRNVITSLRVMGTFDWREFFESVSLVDQVLREESSFGGMDFSTRDRYRHAIEDLARGSGHTEMEVTRAALSLAEGKEDPGLYLISKGRPRLEAALDYRISMRQRVSRAYMASATWSYLGSIFIVTAFLLWSPLFFTHHLGVSTALLVVLGALALFPASDAATALVNRAMMELLPPRSMPRLQLAKGVPPELKTLVVVPTLLTDEEQIAEQIGRLAVHYLANADGELRFAILSDWTDAPTERAPDDQRLLVAAQAAIDALNRQYGAVSGGESRFYLFHRRRVWSASEGCWMGWERKRGKLNELNRLLRGAADTTFLPTPSPPPEGVRYVITLDADTQLPRGAAARLVGTLAHPLNRARLDPRERRVVEGYGILQPRIAPTLPSDRESSIYQRISSGPAGLDPYASAVSDVYQDLFGEGSYTGKGIYDIDAFESALAGRVPEAALLSHDLFEGLFARAGLVSDIDLFEEFPARYEVAAARQHRWARGDWQLLPWIVRGAAGKGATRGRIDPIGRWKMFDNLRRTLSAPAAYLTLLVGWTFPDGVAMVWTKFVLLAIAIPAFIPVSTEILPQRAGVSKRAYVRGLARSLMLAIAQVTLTLVLLAHQAWLMADAMGRTLARLLFTRRRMLEWVSAAQVKASSTLDLPSVYARMGGALILALVAGAVAVSAPGSHWILAVPLVTFWLLSPAVARWISLPPRARPAEQLAQDERETLRATARQSWRFFETFVTAADNSLPPDNFQEDPRPVVARRSSPTNFGLYLLSTASARDLGWLGTLDMADRLEATLATLERLERFRGHFYNWYDTGDLRPLEPRYVSTVDSGNLAGHLCVLAIAIRERISRPLVDVETGRGIVDALRLVRDAAPPVADEAPGGPGERLRAAAEALIAALAAPPESMGGWAARLRVLASGAESLTALAQSLAGEARVAALAGVKVAHAAIAGHRRDLEALAPWAEPLELLVAGLPEARLAGGEGVARLRSTIPALGDMPGCVEAAAHELAALVAAGRPGDRDALDVGRVGKVIEAIERSGLAATALVRRLEELARVSRELFDAMDFEFLYDEPRQLFTIGYRVSDGALDGGRYDLLASEARLTSFVAIARGNVPPSHWFRLGRPMTPVELGTALVSWSGSMFEYLMPSLVMRTPDGSLLDQTSRLVVQRQRAYALAHGVPWGISESAYNVRDLDLTYQYSSFGVPGLGLERGLGEDLVIAPYATALGAMVDAPAAARNFAELARVGGLGAYGYYEALDYTRSRLPEGKRVAVIRAYMAHHQGMTVVALANVLLDGRMRERFHSEPMVQATELLLQERPPRDAVVMRPRGEEVRAPGHVRESEAPVVRRFTTVSDPLPRSHLLSNGRYVLMFTAAGGGYSHCGPLAVTRWREDVTRDAWGSFVFLRDVFTGKVWSAGHQPTGVEADTYTATFLEDRAEIQRRDGSLFTMLEVLVSPEDDAEIRRVSLTNVGNEAREIELTSYAELVLAPARADLAHPAFSNLFVHTEAVPELDTLLATRRTRAPGEAAVWAAHVVTVEGESAGGSQHETDRARFLGRGRGIRTPMSMIEGRPLSNTTGPVLDPIFSLRRRVRLAPGASARIVFTTLLAPTRVSALALADKYRDPATFERTATLAWTQAQVQLHHLGITPDEAHLFQHVANRILYSDARLRAPARTLARNAAGPSGLWGHRISGDLPIVLVRIDEVEDRGIVRQILRAHEYWRMKGLAVDLVILNEKPPSYLQDLQGTLEGLVRAGRPTLTATPEGGVFVLRTDLLSPVERDCLQAAARVVLLSRHGTLAEQVARADRAAPADRAVSTRRREATGAARREPAPEAIRSQPDLEFGNGLGGFVEDGREYMTVLGEGQWTPAPWINVVANARLGFQVSESGAGYVWAENSRENQLTSWSNDPVSDPPSDILYVRDEESGRLWNPTLLPIREDAFPYVCHHGQGYSRFSHTSHEIALELLQFVPTDDPVKISRLRIDNRSRRARRLSVTAYVEWVLGASRATTAPHVVTEMDERTGALLARNAWTMDFPGRVAFLDLRGAQTSWTGDRTEVLGRNGTLDHPDALERGARLSGTVGAGLDPCGALQVSLLIPPEGSVEVVVLLGQGTSAEEARLLVERYRAADLDSVLDAVVVRWNDLVGAVQVKTPDRSLDLMLNRWLLYQTVSCRILGRTGFYQAGGAYGFRDQLQDVLALAVAAPDIARAQLCRAAARQFVEGDVQHWWHPPSGRGVRTRISDDLLWLPYVAAHYMAVTGDRGLLDEEIPFLEGASLHPDEAEAYFEPTVSSQRASLFEHSARALDRSLAVGEHGLPLIGTGDWNDGMNRVGHLGRGESVWLGWFLHATLAEWAPIAAARGEVARAEAWRTHAAALRAALESAGWDGDWYRRAYFDDGTPLGSAENAECRIDSIAQSWAVLSGAAEPRRAARAMAAVEEYLVRREQALVLLFTPAFARTARDPGYIKGYPPGVRENGGQYTHAAIWAIMAWAALGDGDRAGELLSILNPINHTATRAGVYRYRVEPYVVAADVYAEPPHAGRGGWTWYTGSAGWMYRAGIEWLLGFRLRGAALFIDPCIPRAWRGFTLTFRYHSANYVIQVENPRGATRGVTSLELDGIPVTPGPEGLSLVSDGRTHRIRVVLG